MSTIGSLLALMDPNIKPYSEGMESVNRAQRGQTLNQTELIQLAELKRAQEARTQELAFYQQHPEMLVGQQQQPQSVLGSLGPGGGPLQQQTFAPGQPPTTQQVPGGQDLSRFAGVSPAGGGPIPADVMQQVTPQTTPPQSVLANLAPQQQRNPLVDLVRNNPQAGLAVQQQMQAQQDLALKRQEQQLTMGTKVMDYLGRGAQGVTDQASLDAMRSDLVSAGLGKYAAQLPHTYSAEAMAPFIAKALDVKETLQQRIEASKVAALIRGQDVELAKAQQAGGKVNYEKDANGNVVAVPEYAPGGGPVQSRPVLGADGQPIKSLEGQKLTAEQQRHMNTVEGGLRTHVDVLLQPLYAARDAIGRIEQSADQPSAAGDLALITAFMQMIDPRTGVKDAEFRNAQGAGGILDRVQGYIGKLKEGTLLDTDVRADFLQRARKLYEQYDKDYGGVKQQYRDLTSRMGGNPDNVVLDKGSTAAKTPGATGPKVVTRAALQAENARRNVENRATGRPELSNEQAEAMARQKGYEVR